MSRVRDDASSHDIVLASHVKAKTSSDAHAFAGATREKPNFRCARDAGTEWNGMEWTRRGGTIHGGNARDEMNATRA